MGRKPRGEVLIPLKSVPIPVDCRHAWMLPLVKHMDTASKVYSVTNSFHSSAKPKLLVRTQQCREPPPVPNCPVLSCLSSISKIS